jgi:hypothetical protein
VKEIRGCEAGGIIKPWCKVQRQISKPTNSRHDQARRCFNFPFAFCMPTRPRGPKKPCSCQTVLTNTWLRRRA